MATATMSIDWEDFGQVFGKYRYGNITEPVKGSIERQTKIILDLLDETEKKATFFVLGMLASYRPHLVTEIKARGHEIALHGQRHEAMFNLTPVQAREDILTSKKIVENIIGCPVYGYRAPFFSIKKENLYLLEILAELDILYDSSIFPMGLPRYGIAHFSPENILYNLPGNKQIVELPMTTSKFLKRKLPVSGGGYIRLLPAFLVKRIFDNLDKSEIDSMIYMHPYEFDTERISVADNYPPGADYSHLKKAATDFRWNILRSGVTAKLRSLLQRHKFATCLEKAHLVYVRNNPINLIGD